MSLRPGAKRRCAGGPLGSPSSADRVDCLLQIMLGTRAGGFCLRMLSWLLGTQLGTLAFKMFFQIQKKHISVKC